MADTNWEYYTPSQHLKTNQPGPGWGIHVNPPEDPSHPAIIRVRLGADREAAAASLSKLARAAQDGARTASDGEVDFEAKDWCDLEKLAEALEVLARELGRRRGTI